ncbi:DUF5133 domain-containing protein [Streptomyces sp. DSM 41770]|uniref:DUF5133 domain-containing protein n=2 Tax=Streptomyces TaxID=1883 RepID=A0ABU2RJ43_9ACTN|nr:MULTISPECIES: DUF5133 domain-containing protein [unclassified Streptomyces]MDT0428872.1 DUF5133 domain-containing protein [Streptomyces sp. DSM 41770]
MAHPVILRGLVDRYHELLAQDSAQGSQETRCQLEDVTYTLCVSTGTRTADEALAVAEQQLTAALRDPALSDPALRGGRSLDAQLTAS